MYVDNKGIIAGSWRGERKCINPKAGDADLWIKIWEKRDNLAAGDILVEVEHVKEQRTQEDKKEVSHFEKFVTEGNEKADELAKEGALWCEGFMAEVRAKTVQQERRSARSLALSHCLVEENGRIVKSSCRSQKKGGELRIRKENK